jgi:hypothetical protein
MEKKINVQPERLNPEGTKDSACDSLTQAYIYEGLEGDPKRFPRLEIGHKSNRLEQTILQDQEGKIYALYKSSLIDLETLQGDKGQAKAA